MSTSNRNIEQYPAEARRSQDFSRQQLRRGHTGTLYQQVTERRVTNFKFGKVPMNRLTWGQETKVPWIPNRSRPTWSATLDVKLGRRWGGVIRGGGIHCHGVITIFSNPEGKLKKSILISGACTRMSNRCTRFPTSAGSHGTTGVRQTTLNSFNN